MKLEFWHNIDRSDDLSSLYNISYYDIHDILQDLFDNVDWIKCNILFDESTLKLYFMSYDNSAFDAKPFVDYVPQLSAIFDKYNLDVRSRVITTDYEKAVAVILLLSNKSSVTRPFEFGPFR